MNKEEAKKRIYQALEIKAREDSHIIGSPYVSWVETADKIDAIIDSLTIDHQKVKLPREVGVVVDEYRHYAWASMTDLLYWFHSTSTEKMPKSVAGWVDNVEMTKKQSILADAYRYGWEAEPEAKWYVQAPESWKADGCGVDWLYKPSRGGVDMCTHTGESDEQFTRAEIKKYHLDSDIFTLVPVEYTEVSR